jgi:hypothetical protein
MPFISIRSLLGTGSAALVALAVAPLALAQSAPIKPGLWEVRAERESNGQKSAMTNERMQKLPPETRAKIDAMMKERGVGMGPGGINRICLGKASLDRGAWQRQSGCKTDYGSLTGSSWKWHSVCPQFESESDGEAVFPNSETYAVKVTTTTKLHGETRISHMTMNAKWLGGNCGDLKPFEPGR